MRERGKTRSAVPLCGSENFTGRLLFGTGHKEPDPLDEGLAASKSAAVVGPQTNVQLMILEKVFCQLSPGMIGELGDHDPGWVSAFHASTHT
jgi:hypothetical protein